MENVELRGGIRSTEFAVPRGWLTMANSIATPRDAAARRKAAARDPDIRLLVESSLMKVP